MDTVTQAALGAVIGQAGFHRRLGGPAAAWGAGGGVLPALAALLVPALGPLAEFQYHRGGTHALWFGPLVGSVLGCAVWRWSRARAVRAGRPPETTGPLGAWVA